MAKKRKIVKKNRGRIQISCIGIRRVILPILSDSNYKYKKPEVNGMCLKIQKNLTDSSLRAINDLNSIVILK